jgi:hypothetical protein
MPTIISPEELRKHSLQVPSGWIKNEMFVDWCEHFFLWQNRLPHIQCYSFWMDTLTTPETYELLSRLLNFTLPFAISLYTQAPAIRQNIHGTTETLLRKNKNGIGNCRITAH